MVTILTEEEGCVILAHVIAGGICICLMRMVIWLKISGLSVGETGIMHQQADAYILEKERLTEQNTGLAKMVSGSNNRVNKKSGVCNALLIF